jgi:hypothetical protein
MKIYNLLARMHECPLKVRLWTLASPNSIIHLLPIIDQKTKTTCKIKTFKLLVFDIFFIALVPKTFPPLASTTKKENIKSM